MAGNTQKVKRPIAAQIITNKLSVETLRTFFFGAALARGKRLKRKEKPRCRRGTELAARA